MCCLCFLLLVLFDPNFPTLAPKPEQGLNHPKLLRYPCSLLLNYVEYDQPTYSR